MTSSEQIAALADEVAERVNQVGRLAAQIKALAATPDPGPDPDPGPQPEPTADTAAARHGWGTPFWFDEFTTGGVDPAKWQLPGAPGVGWPGHAGNGRRMPGNTTVADGVMTLRGDANGDTGWVRAKPALGRRDLTGGVRIEIRSRAFNTGPSGAEYHALHLIWPTAGADGRENRFRDGEYDWSESKRLSGDRVGYFLHFPGTTTNHQVGDWEAIGGVDITQWHNYAMEWKQGAGGYIAGFIDGQQRYRHAEGAISGQRGRIQDMPEGRLTIQLDNFTGNSGLRPAKFEVAWVRMYALGTAA